MIYRQPRDLLGILVPSNDEFFVGQIEPDVVVAKLALQLAHVFAHEDPDEIPSNRITSLAPSLEQLRASEDILTSTTSLRLLAEQS